MTTKELTTIGITSEPGFPDPEPEPNIVLDLDVFIDEPDPNEDVKSPVVVTGRVTCIATDTNANPPTSFDGMGMVQEVQVKFGNGTFQTATTSDGWRHWSISRSRSQGTTSVTARVTAEITDPFQSPEIVTDEVTVSNVFVDTTAPSLTVDTPDDATAGPPYQIDLSGSASDNRGVKRVRWRLGSGSFQQATNDTGDWSGWSDTVILNSLGSRTVTVQAEDEAGNTRTQTVTVRALDETQPTLDITEPHPNDVFTLLGDSITVRIAGTTVDSQSGIQSVRWRLAGGTFADVVPVAANDWSSWHADVVLNEAGAHGVELEATDTADQTATATVTLNVAEPFDTDDPLAVVSSPAYLEDLLTFATFRVNHESSDQAITRADLEAAFQQPFERLVAKEFRAVATAPVAQVRLCIEVLRRYLAGNGRRLTAVTEQTYRRAAYTTLLRNLGTSFDELRLARAADAETRAALADRLGITLSGSRPDFLDVISLDPNILTEVDLESLFGLADTTRAAATLPEPFSLPIVDPDRVFESDFVDPTAGTPAYDLWLARAAFVSSELQEIRNTLNLANSDQEALELLFDDFLDATSSTIELFNRYDAGEDITNELNGSGGGLDMPGFLLVKDAHERASAGETIRDEEWELIFAAIVKAEKTSRRNTWRNEEEAAGITLSPTFFRSAPTRPLLPFRASYQDRRAWEAALNGDDSMPPLLLARRQSHMRQRWLTQDGARRSDFEAGEPIIDPDRVFETDFRDATPGNPAYDIWLERQAWVTAEIDGARVLRDGAATPLAGLEAIFDAAFGSAATMQALYAAHLAGEDISLDLLPLRLTMIGFLTLSRFHELLLAGAPVLEEEWDHIFSIVVQAAKIGEYDTWLAEEQAAAITLSPDFFETAPAAPLVPFRSTAAARRDWEVTLRARVEQAAALQQTMLTTIQSTEERVLPTLRDALVAKAAAPVTDDTDLDDVANRLSHELAIDVKGSGNQQTTRTHQAIETIQSALFSLRTGRFQNLTPVLGSSPAAGWTFESGYSETEFDEEWRWMGTHATWRTAMFVFGYPENYLLPNLRPAQTAAFKDLVAAVQNQPRLTPTKARSLINGSSNSYIEALQNEIGTLPVGAITDQLSEAEMATWRTAARDAFLNGDGSEKFESPHDAPLHIQEIFFAVPLLMALQLQKAGHYLVALDWFQLVYAYEQAIDQRKIYYGLVQEAGIETIYQRVMGSWLLAGMNPHSIAHVRQNAMTQFTLMSLVRCFLDFADSEFTQDTRESLPRARSLYLTALDLLDLPEMQPPTDGNGELISPFPPNPLLASLRAHVEMNLAKLRSGRNIAGLERQIPVDNQTAASLLPTVSANGQINTLQSVPQRATLYRYPVLIDRAKQLVNIAQQVETALLAAIEKRDNEEYHLLKARQDLQLTDATVQLQTLRVTEAESGITLAELQRDRSQLQQDHFDQLLQTGISRLEQQMLDSMSDSLKYQRLATALNDFNTMVSVVSFIANPASSLFSNPFASAAQSLNARAQEASTVASVRQTLASFERREQTWRLQSQLARQDVLIGEQQITIAENHVGVVLQEKQIAEIQSGHAAETLNFLANKFTNAELYEWMSQILLRAYNFFLQQATAMAKLAERQLAFERLEALPPFIRADYWQPPTDAAVEGGESTRDRLGLTGPVQLQQDITRLDQYAFETKQRKLQLSQTFSLSQLSPAEFQRFRETGVLRFNTPMSLFDHAFPGHFMRLTKRVKVSLLALVPPVDGVRATLTSSGISRVVVGGDTFQRLTVQRDPEQIAFTAPTNATGLLDLEPQSEMLLPFEGMGVDATWELQLPKAANQFDYRTIADVLFTIEYTALSSSTYRQQVIQQLERTVSADRMFNFRDTFADQWFDLHNRNQSATPMVVQFDIRREDFPPNLADLQVQHVLLYFVREDGVNVEVPVTHLHLTPSNETNPLGGSALTVDGTVSTRRSNGQAWSDMIGAAPVGLWELALDGTLQDGRPVATLFDEEAIEDILLVVTYAGETPAWVA